MNITEREVWWLVGLLEGEATFLSGPPSDRNRPVVRLEMTDYDIIERVAMLWDTPIRHRTYSGGRGEAWMTRLRGGQAMDLMLLLRPYMSQRRQQQIARVSDSYELKAKRRTTLPATLLDAFTRAG